MNPSVKHLGLPFFDDAHRQLAPAVATWAAAQTIDEHDDRAACRQWVRCGIRGLFAGSQRSTAKQE